MNRTDSNVTDNYVPECHDCRSYERELQQAEKRIAELEARPRQMHMYVWFQLPFYVAIAQAETTEIARSRMLSEIDEPDESCPERKKAHRFVSNNQPAIWHGLNAEFALTDSAQCIEMGAEIERLTQLVRTLQQQLPKSEGAS